MSFGIRDYLSRLQTLLVFLISNGTAKNKLAILAILVSWRDQQKPQDLRL